MTGLLTCDELAALLTRHALPSRLLAELVAAYATPPRAYHAFGHVLEVADRFIEVEGGPGWARPREVLAAVLFHDAVYEATRTDNEPRSAALARTVPPEALGRLVPRLPAGEEACRHALRYLAVAPEGYDAPDVRRSAHDCR